MATAVQIPTAAVRGGSSVTTAGIGNSSVSTGEAVGSGLVSMVALFIPIAIPFILVAILVGSIQIVRRRRRAAATDES